MKFRYLTADEIECRIATVKNNGISLLLYKDARCDMRILDETVGSMNWCRSHEVVNGNLFCNVGIYNEDRGEWVYKQDVGTESYTEKQKGEASDSFKRACFNWGIGRELYTAPFIWIPSGKVEIKDGKCYERFEVQDITIEEGRIVGLVIRNAKTKAVVFDMNYKPSEAGISEGKYKNLLNMMQKAEVTEEQMKDRYHIESLMLINEEQYEDALVALAKQMKGKK